MDKLKITLGVTEFELDEPNFEQLRVIMPAVNRVSGASGSGVTEAIVDDWVRIIHAGISTSNPDFKIADVWKLKPKRAQIVAAVNAVVQVSGLVERPQGEVLPAATTQS